MTMTELLLLILVAIVATAFVLACAITWRVSRPFKLSRGALDPGFGWGKPTVRKINPPWCSCGCDPNECACLPPGFEALPRIPARTQKIILPLSYVDPADAKARLANRAPGHVLDTTPPKLLKIEPGKMIEIIQRQQNVAFRPERIVIDNAKDWMVHDIKVGNRSQFSQRGDVPGEVFAANAQGTEFSFETVQTAMDFAITVSYRGPNTEGDFFSAAVIGTAAL